MYDVIGIGRAVKDFIVAVEKIPEGDNGTGALFVSAQFGGKVSTAVAAAARQGLSASMYGTIGKDAKGEMVKEDFEWHGVDTSHLYLIEGKDTPLCIALAEASTQTRKFIGTPADVPVLIPDKLDLDYLKQARCIHLEGGYPVAKEAAAFAKANGILSSVDASIFNTIPVESSVIAQNIATTRFRKRVLFAFISISSVLFLILFLIYWSTLSSMCEHSSIFTKILQNHSSHAFVEAVFAVRL